MQRGEWKGHVWLFTQSLESDNISVTSMYAIYHASSTMVSACCFSTSNSCDNPANALDYKHGTA